MDRLSSSGSLSRFAYHALQNNQVRVAPFSDVTALLLFCSRPVRVHSIKQGREVFMMSMWKCVGLGIGLILLGALFESGFAANMMVAVSMTVFIILFAAGPVAGSVSRRPGW